MIHFDEPSHTYTTDTGERIPGVTSILSPLSDFEHVPYDTLQRAAEFGNHVHRAVELHIDGRLDWDSLDDALVPYVKAADVWLARPEVEVVDREVVVYHEQLGYAGKLDLVANVRKRRRVRLTVLDWKSGVLPQSVGPQTAAYGTAYTLNVGRTGFDRACVLLRDNGMPSEYTLTNPSDWNTFLSCLNIWRFKNL